MRPRDAIAVNKAVERTEGIERAHNEMMVPVSSFGTAFARGVQSNPDMARMRLGELWARGMADPNSTEGELLNAIKRTEGLKISTAASGVSAAAGGRATQQEVLLSRDGILLTNKAGTTLGQLARNYGELVDNGTQAVSNTRRSRYRLPGQSGGLGITRDQLGTYVKESGLTPRQARAKLLHDYPNAYFEEER